MNEDLIQPGEWVTSKNLDFQTQLALRIQPNTRYQVLEVEQQWLRLDQVDEMSWWISSRWFVREDEFVRKLREVL